MKNLLLAALLLLGSVRVFAQQILIEDHILNAGDIYLGPAHNIKTGPLAGVQFLNLIYTPIGGSSFSSCLVGVDTDVPPPWNVGGAISGQNCASTGTYSSPSAVSANNVRVNAGAVGNGTVHIQLWGCFSSCTGSGAGTITGINTAAGSGLTGGGMSGTLSLSLGS